MDRRVRVAAEGRRHDDIGHVVVLARIILILEFDHRVPGEVDEEHLVVGVALGQSPVAVVRNPVRGEGALLPVVLRPCTSG